MSATSTSAQHSSTRTTFATANQVHGQTYIIDAENATELARLVYHDRELQQVLGGNIPADQLPSSMQHVLDLACGPGGWALEMARAYRQTQVVGVDISHNMLEYARSLAQVQHLKNIEFRQMNILQPLDFPDQSFDLINARLLRSFMKPAHWPALLAECQRICRPGGTICLTESELPLTNSSACEKVSKMITQDLKRIGQSTSPDGRQLGITPLLGRFLYDSGFVKIQLKAHVYNLADNDGWQQNNLATLRLLEPFLTRMHRLSPEQFDQLFDQVARSIEDERFCGIQFFLSAWGRKPLSEAPL